MSVSGVKFVPQYNNSVVKRNIASFRNKKYKRDVVNFEGCFLNFGTHAKLDVEVLQGVSADFVSNVKECIQKFPAYWLKQLRRYNYKAVLSPSWSEAYRKQGIKMSFIEQQEKANPRGTLGLTNTAGLGGKNFFVFCDKPPLSSQYTHNIVNHELSHGVVDIAQLDESRKVLGILESDFANVRREGKLDRLSLDEKRMFSHFFSDKKPNERAKEILADCFAWAHGKGCYGTKVASDISVDNPELMPSMFPQLTEYLKRF